MASPAPGRTSEAATIDRSVFEGLFSHTLKPSDELSRDLVAIGYDSKDPQRRYPASVWIAAVQVACRHAFPGVEETEAQNRLGKLYIDGFLSTIIGRLIGVSLLVLGPEAVIKRIPRWAGMNATGVEISVAQTAPGIWKATWKDYNALPHLIAGMMQAGASRAGFTSVELAEKRDDGFDLIIRFPSTRSA